MAIAFKIAAEPGWRAVSLTVGEKSADDTYEITARVHTIAAWGVHGREVPHGLCGGNALFGPIEPAMVIGDSFGGFGGGGVSFVPLDEDGKSIVAHRIAKPSPATDDDLLDAAKTWLEAVEKKVTGKRLLVKIVR